MTADRDLNFAARYIKPGQIGNEMTPPGIRIAESMVSVYMQDGTLHIRVDHDCRADAPPVLVWDRTEPVWRSPTAIETLTNDMRHVLRRAHEWYGTGWFTFADLAPAGQVIGLAALMTAVSSLDEAGELENDGAVSPTDRRYRLTPAAAVLVANLTQLS